MTIRPLVTGLVMVAVFAVLGTVRADDPSDETELAEREAESVHEWTAVVAGEIRVTSREGETGDEVRLEQSEKPLLKWSLPEVGRVYGDVYVWSEGGRPRAIASLYEWFHPHEGRRTVEWCSVTERSMRAEFGGRELWRTGPAEVVWRTVPGPGRPHRTEAGRLVQMRAIARRFSARLEDDRTDEKGVEKPLRLLSSPLHRYACPGEDVLDGGVFAFVLGSDPEAILLIEARQPADGGAEEWQVLVTRMNSSPLAVKYDGRELQRFDDVPLDRLWSSTQPYCLQQLPSGGGS